MNAYIIVEMAKKNQDIGSDRAFALKNGLSTQNIVDWKAGKSLPGWDRLEILAHAAGIEIWEAVKIMKENEIKQKAANDESGFTSMANMIGLASLSSLSLLSVHQPEYSPILCGLALAACGTLYIMRSETTWCVTQGVKYENSHSTLSKPPQLRVISRRSFAHIRIPRFGYYTL